MMMLNYNNNDIFVYEFFCMKSCIHVHMNAVQSNFHRHSSVTTIQLHCCRSHPSLNDCFPHYRVPSVLLWFQIIIFFLYKELVNIMAEIIEELNLTHLCLFLHLLLFFHSLQTINTPFTKNCIINKYILFKGIFHGTSLQLIFYIVLLWSFKQQTTTTVKQPIFYIHHFCLTHLSL